MTWFILRGREWSVDGACNRHIGGARSRAYCAPTV